MFTDENLCPYSLIKGGREEQEGEVFMYLKSKQ